MKKFFLIIVAANLVLTSLNWLANRIAGETLAANINCIDLQLSLILLLLILKSFDKNL
jgi:hypothetical protein